MDAKRWEDLLVRAARAAAGHRSTVADRPVVGLGREEAWAAFAAPCPTGPPTRAGARRAGRRGRRRRWSGTRRPALLRVRHRRRAARPRRAADMLAAGWDQARSTRCSSPAAEAAERAAGALGQGAARPARRRRRSASSPAPRPANTVGLAVGRHHVLEPRPAGTSSATACTARRRCGWSPARSATPRSTGRCGCSASAPPASSRCAADANGAIDVDDLRERAGRRAGPGRRSCACRPATSTPAPATTSRAAVAAGARRHGAWVHVDGAFGLWAAASPRHAGTWSTASSSADSWGDRRAQVAQRALRQRARDLRGRRGARPAMSYTAAYLTGLRTGRLRARRPGARVVAPGPRLRGLGGAARARALGRGRAGRPVLRRWPGGWPSGSRAGGATIANEVVLNQVLVGFGDRARTDAVIEAVQRDGTCWLGGTTWRGRRLIRISVSNGPPPRPTTSTARPTPSWPPPARSAPSDLPAG